MEKRKSLIQNTVILFISMIICKVLGAVFKIFLTNIIGGVGMGYYSAAYSIFSPVFALTAAGIPTVIIRLVAGYTLNNDEESSFKVLKSALFVFGLVGIVGSAFVFFTAVPFAEIIAKSPESIPAIFIISPSVFFCCISSVIKGYYEGKSNLSPSSVSNVLESIVRTVLGILFSFAVMNYAKDMYESGRDLFGNNVTSFSAAIRIAAPYSAAAAIASITIGEILSAVFLYIKYRISNIKFYNNKYVKIHIGEMIRIGKYLIKESIPIAICAVLINLTSFIDLITINRCISIGIESNPYFFTTGLSDIINEHGGAINTANFLYGCYNGIAMTVFMLIPSFTGLVGRGALPDITSAWKSGDKKRFADKIILVIKSNVIIGAPMYLGMAALSKEIVYFLFSGRESEASVSFIPLFILSFGGIFLSLTSTFFSVFQLIGRTDLPIKITIISSAVKLIVNVFTIVIPQINISGAAISMVASYMVSAICGLLALESYANIEINLFKNSFIPVLSAIFCALSARTVFDFSINWLNQFFSLVIAVASALLIYLFLLNITRVIELKYLLNRQK